MAQAGPYNMTPKEQDITEQMVALPKETILATNYFELAREKHLADPGDAILRWFLHCKQKLEGLKRRKNKPCLSGCYPRILGGL